MTKNEPTKPTTEAAVAQAAQVAQFSPGPTPPTTAAPKAAGLLHELQYAGKKQKKKRKYSRDLKEFQQVERGLAKANRRVARAIASGFNEYYQLDNRSSHKKRDGAIRDALKNWSKSLGKVVRKSSNAPYDVVNAFDTKTIRRTVRRTVRLFASPFLR
jgi:hypothetical protein